jgi:glycerol kinase
LDRLVSKAGRSAPVLPALAGLAAPYWDARAEAVVSGLTLATDRTDLARGFLDGVAFLISRIADAAKPKRGYRRVMASGGLSSMDALLQAQANALGCPVARCRVRETSAWGAAALAGVGAGVWKSVEETARLAKTECVFHPTRLRRDLKSQFRAWDILVTASQQLGDYTEVSHSG